MNCSEYLADSLTHLGIKKNTTTKQVIKIYNKMHVKPIIAVSSDNYHFWSTDVDNGPTSYQY